MAYKVLNNISLKDIESSGLSKLKTDVLVIVINKDILKFSKNKSSFIIFLNYGL